jgi:hypothetical protein
MTVTVDVTVALLWPSLCFGLSPAHAEAYD